MLKLICRIYCNSHLTDEPVLPKSFFDMIEVWMNEHDVDSLYFYFDEVSEDE